MRTTLIAGLARRSQKGVALVTVLLMLALMSAMAVALVYKVNHEQHLQAADSGNTAAYYGAEAGMEKMMADLSLLYTQIAAPTTCDIVKLQNAPPPVTVNNVGNGFTVTTAVVEQPVASA